MERVHARYLELTEQIPAITYTAALDKWSTTLSISPQVGSLLGISPEEFAADPQMWTNCLHPEDRERTLAELQKCQAHGDSLRLEYRLIARNGQIHWILDQGVVLRDRAGNPVCLHGVMLDITERKHAEQALLRSEARSRALLETAPDGILLVGEAGRIELLNPAAEQLFGYSAADAIGLDVRALIPAFHNVKPTREDEHGPARNGEAIARHQDGTSFPIDLAVGEVHLDDRRLFTAIVRDITDRKVLQEQLFQAQKMEAVGRLAGGIAHDFNNYLTVMSCNIDLMVNLLKDSPAGHADLLASLEQMRKAWQGATSLTRQLLAFSRRHVVRAELLDADDLIGGMERMLRPLIGEHIHLEVTGRGPTGRIRADAGQIEQVVMNLVVNARDAMPEGGTLRIETSRETLAAGRALLPEAAPGEYLCITVADTGMGMSPEVVRHIFEPFYTTKPVGKGTGLGLSTVYAIVQQSGGYITVDSAPLRGTSFHVYLPIAEDPALLSPASAQPASDRGRETILVCEDEPTVLRLTSNILKSKGYRVLSATDPGRAIELALTYSGNIDLLVTDVIMPEMNGVRLAETMVDQYPEMAVLFVSGYTADIIDDHGVSAEGVEILEKPFTPSALLQRVRAVLDRSAGSTGNSPAGSREKALSVAQSLEPAASDPTPRRPRRQPPSVLTQHP